LPTHPEARDRAVFVRTLATRSGRA
jgi:hypothetical protein